MASDIKRNVNIDGMPHFERSMERIEAWFEQEIIDRAPVRFNVANPERANPAPRRQYDKHYESYRERWFDYESTIDNVADWLAGRKFIAETFPAYHPNLGPGVYAAFYGAELEFMADTSWTVPILKNAGDAKYLKLDWDNIYLRTIDAMTDYAVERLKGIALVGYTDLHPGADCVAEWLDSQEMCLKLKDDPEGVLIAVDKAEDDFLAIYDHFDDKLKRNGQLSISWLGIPSYGRMHIPSCDFSYMISGDDFRKFCLPGARREMRTMTHNAWHLDGDGCARHLDDLLEVKELHAIQWVQGAGRNEAIMQWVPLIKRILSSGKSVMVSMKQDELEPFIDAVPPKGVHISIQADTDETAREMLRRIEKWT